MINVTELLPGYKINSTVHIRHSDLATKQISRTKFQGREIVTNRFLLVILINKIQLNKYTHRIFFRVL